MPGTGGERPQPHSMCQDPEGGRDGRKELATVKRPLLHLLGE